MNASAVFCVNTIDEKTCQEFFEKINQNMLTEKEFCDIVKNALLWKGMP